MAVPKVPRFLKYIFISSGVFFVLAIVVLGGMAFAYRNKFYPGVSVGGIALGGLTHAEGSAKLADQTSAYLGEKVVVAVNDVSQGRDAKSGQYPLVEVSTTTKGLGLTFSSDQALAGAWQVGHQRSWQWLASALHAFFSGTNQSLQYTSSQDAIATFVNGQVIPKVVTPQPARIEIQNGTAVVTPSVPGVQVDTTTLAADITNRLATATDGGAIYVYADSTIADSPITSAVVQPVADELNSLANESVDMTADGVRLVPARTDLLTWYQPVQDDSNHISLAVQTDKIQSYIQTKGGAVLDIQKSTAAAVAALTTAIATPKPSVQVALVNKPQATVVEADVMPGSYSVGDYPGKYIEVNLKEQKLYRMNGTTLEKVYLVSTGAWYAPTPVGTFTLDGHIKRAWSNTYKLWMPDWINFKDNQYGLHAFPEWPDGYKEGVDHLGKPVSHGCIRLSDADAEEIYNWTPDGTPLIIRAS